MIVIAFLQLIRWKNLVMIVCIQLLFKYIYFSVFSVATTLSGFDFSILLLATITIAAAGYIINDIYDVEADKINKPNKVIIGKKISKKQGYNYYYLLNSIGLIAGLYVAYRINKLSFIAIFIITALLLKVYNSDFKKRPLTGNIIVSLLVSLSILIVGVFDVIPAITDENVVEQYHAFRVLIDYSVFAFMFMLLREIVKDIEDVNGDKKLKMKTLPILLGRRRAKNIVFALSFVPLILVTLYSFNNFSNVPFILAYMLIIVMLPLLHFMTKIIYAKTKKDYTYASNLLKFIMLLGMLSILIISLNIHYAK
ncbi:MAG: geranylgeranylglycerol-phosphate geranylgeranyltransferase [Flavobacteriaceae bacterium]|nr:geranylgeranylglycerol-phosphate geranylgeranyltransferase [Flavobacteriaceae bacterium]